MNIEVTVFQAGTQLCSFMPDGHYMTVIKDRIQLIAKNAYQGDGAYDRLFSGWSFESQELMEKLDPCDQSDYWAILFRRNST